MFRRSLSNEQILTLLQDVSEADSGEDETQSDNDKDEEYVSLGRQLQG